MADNEDFEQIYYGSSTQQGRLRFTKGGLGWKCQNDPSAELILVSHKNIRSAQWMRVARGYQLRVQLERADRHDFQGLGRDDKDRIRRIMRATWESELELEERETSSKGWNWGKAEVQAHDLSFTVQQKTAFEIPLASIANSNMAGKNEVAIELAPLTLPGPAPSRPLDELVEMRFYIPQRASRGDDSDDEAESDEGEVDDEGNEISAAQSFHDRIKKAARVGDTAGEEIVSFSDVLVVTPRGRYEIEMHLDHLRLRGKTYDYKVTYKSIQRQFSLPKLDEKHHQMIISVDPPLRQGQTKYPFLVMQFPVDEEVDLTLNMEDDEIEERFKGKLKKDYSDQTHVIMATLFEALVGKEIIPAGSFSSVDGGAGIKCNVKAIQGELYFLEKGMLFIAKSPINIDFSQVTKALFTRVTGAMRNCDITFQLNDDSEHTFTAINKDELPSIKTYLKARNVRVKEQADDVGMRDPTKLDLGDDGEDEDMEDSDEEDEDDARRKPLGKPRGGGDDDDSEEDGDFQADSDDDDGGSTAGSDSESDLESNVSDDMMKDAAKKAKKADGGKAKPKAVKETNGKAKAGVKSAEMIDISDEDDDADVDMEGGDDDDEPPQKKARRD